MQGNDESLCKEKRGRMLDRRTEGQIERDGERKIVRKKNRKKMRESFRKGKEKEEKNDNHKCLARTDRQTD